MVCAYTGVRLVLSAMEIDHRQPLKRGGTNDLANLCVCHRDANAAKGTMTEGEFRALLALITSWQDRGRSVLQRLRAAGRVFRR